MPTNSVGASETFAGRSGTSCDLTSNRRIEREAPAWGFEPQSPGPKPGSLVQTSLRGQPGRNPLPDEPNRATVVRLAHPKSATRFIVRAMCFPPGAVRSKHFVDQKIVCQLERPREGQGCPNPD